MARRKYNDTVTCILRNIRATGNADNIGILCDALEEAYPYIDVTPEQIRKIRVKHKQCIENAYAHASRGVKKRAKYTRVQCVAYWFATSVKFVADTLKPGWSLPDFDRLYKIGNRWYTEWYKRPLVTHCYAAAKAYVERVQEEKKGAVNHMEDALNAAIQCIETISGNPE